jgi:predicted transcriptional regulator
MTETLLDAALNPQLRDVDVRLLNVLNKELDTVDFRPIKQLWICRLLDRSQPTIARSLQRLAEQGYIERRDAQTKHGKQRARGGIHSYRVIPINTQAAA